MNKELENKVDKTIAELKKAWDVVRHRNPFVAFSTGKDSLLVASLLYEAVAPERPICLYSHHPMEFQCFLDYLETLRERFDIHVVKPFLEYFELMDRGIGFLTLKDPWCVPLLVGTGILEWFQQRGVASPQHCFMFRGMSGGEFSHKWHSKIEVYDRLNLPTMNPILGFNVEEILEVLRERYRIPLNPIYEHMNRTYCICCYTSDQKRQAYSEEHHPEVCRKYYGQIEEMLFDSGLIHKTSVDEKYKTKEEKLERHGFVHWNRIKEQNTVGAIKQKVPPDGFCYHIRDEAWINTKHLLPVEGRWKREGNKIIFWNIPEGKCDCLIKRMLNCLDCGFCMVQCFPVRHFNRENKTLELTNCLKCGQCINLKFCMGCKHRFWRRTIAEK